MIDLVHGRVQSRDGPNTPARTRCGGRRRGSSSSSGGWDRGVTSISRCAAAREKCREKFIGISSKVIDFRRVDGGEVTFVAKFVVVIALGPRDVGRVVACRDRFQVLFIVEARKHVVVVNHGACAVLNLERGHAVLGGQFLDSSND